MKRVVVHLGLRKTATTSIQSMLDTHADLLPTDIKVISRGQSFDAWREYVYRYMSAPAELAAEYKSTMLAGVEDEIRKLARWFGTLPEDTILISDENLFSARVFAHGETIFDWANEILPIVETHWADHDLTFLLYLRDESTWLRSCHNQEVKNNRLGLSYLEWSAQIPERFNLRSNAQDLASRLNSKVIIVDMEAEAASPGGLGHAIFAAVGMTDAEIERLPVTDRLNQGLPQSALEFMIAVNRLDIPDASKPAIGQLASKLRHLFA